MNPWESFPFVGSKVDSLGGKTLWLEKQSRVDGQWCNKMSKSSLAHTSRLNGCKFCFGEMNSWSLLLLIVFDNTWSEMATSVISDNANTFFDILPHETTLYGTYDDTWGHLMAFDNTLWVIYKVTPPIIETGNQPRRKCVDKVPWPNFFRPSHIVSTKKNEIYINSYILVKTHFLPRELSITEKI